MKKVTAEKYFYGDLVRGSNLDKIARKRKKEYEEKIVSQAEQALYLKQGWQLKKQFKHKARLRREKKCDKLLEDEVWLLFKNMGFTEMNKDRNFRIRAEPQKKQIDVFAKEGNNVFIIECKARSRKGKSESLIKDIREWLSLKDDIKKSLWGYYKHPLTFSILFVTKNIIWTSTAEELASTSEKEKFFVWKEKDLKAYKNITDQQGESARFQMYSILFPKKRIKELQDIQVPSMKGGIGKKKHYVFLIQPEKLLNGVVQVHRREKSRPEEVSETYQRMLNKTRLREICKYIDKGGYFPNNIILNFKYKPTFEPIKKRKVFGNIAYGILKFPPYYGSAWIIDGQHRLYGYLKSKKRKTALLPVVAFEDLKIKDQANLFVEINEEQKKIDPNLLWELYPDIYEGEKDERYQILRTISLIVQKLNSEPDSPLYKHIYIPSLPSAGKDSEGRKITNLKLKTICDVIRDERLVKKSEGCLFNDNYETTVNFAYERLKAYFEIIKEANLEDWNRGDEGLFRTNIGVGIFIILLKPIIKWIVLGPKGKIIKKKDLSEFKEECRKLLSPALKWLDSIDRQGRSEIRKATSKGLRMGNTVKLVFEIESQNRGFGRELIESWTLPEYKLVVSEIQVRKKTDKLEKQIRHFVAEKLTQHYNEKWWREDIISRDIMDYAERGLRKEFKKIPYERRKKESSPQEKLEHVDIGSITKIILKGSNWHIFQKTFVDKEYTQAYFRFFKDFRDPDKHTRETLDPNHIRLMAYGAAEWIRKCIGLDDTENKS